MYRNNAKYWDALSSYHTCAKILNSPFYYIFTVCIVNSVDPDQTRHSATSDPGLLCKDLSVTVVSITKTYLYNFDPLKPHFYIVKLGFTGVYIIFLISDQNIVCGYSLEPPRRGGSNEYPQSMFCAEI